MGADGARSSGLQSLTPAAEHVVPLVEGHHLKHHVVQLAALTRRHDVPLGLVLLTARRLAEHGDTTLWAEQS